MSNHYQTTDFCRREPEGADCGCGLPESTPCQPECGCQSNCASQNTCSCQSSAVEEESSTCCKEDLLSALRMLFRKPLNRYLDYDQVAVLTQGAVLGAPLTQPDTAAANYDNLAGPLSGTLGRVSSSTCDLLDVSGPTYMAVQLPNGTDLADQLTDLTTDLIAGIDVSASTELADLVTALRALVPQLSAGSPLVAGLLATLTERQILADEISKVPVCAVKALAIGTVAGATDAASEENYENAKQTLLWMLGNGSYPGMPGPGPCFPCPPPRPYPGGPRPPRPPRPWYEAEADEDLSPRCRWVCDDDCDPCSCTAGVLGRLTGDDGSNTGVSLTASQLVLSGADVLGSVNNVLVLANDTDRRFYFLCASEVGFMD